MKWTRKFRLTMIQMLRSKQGASKIALGIVFGFFPCWFPTFGIGPAMSIGLTKLVRGSVTGALLAAGVGSFAWPLLFYLNYAVGSLWTSQGVNVEVPDVRPGEGMYQEAAESVHSWQQMGMDFVIGAVLNSIVFTAVGYFIVRYLVHRYRHRFLWLVRSRKRKLKHA
ncbi:DUF2062 domain-containing protein [Paenibacillus sp. OSY-SE]|uniref:DUF2062 domain-containing protein n=1 Tax=Paenibacillus sp. OSY-SE TaxID=1196323 RepID=UPI000369CBAF|nr:DUF2062 domain-containing protein [Paenibacillus sp. OSY-SE]